MTGRLAAPVVPSKATSPGAGAPTAREPIAATPRYDPDAARNLARDMAALKVKEAATALRAATGAIDKLEAERAGLRRRLEQLESDLRTGIARADRERNILAEQLAASEERTAVVLARLEALEAKPPRLEPRVAALEALVSPTDHHGLPVVKGG